MGKRALLYPALAIFLGAIGWSWFTHGQGVVRDDPDRHIAIPSPLTMPLQIQAAYNGQDVYFRYRWPSPKPGIFHDVLRFDGGKWEVRGRAVPGSQPDGLHEDRVAMMLDDGSVPEFARYGGYVAIGPGLAGLTNEVSGKELEGHPYLGGKLKQDEPTKYLPATRRNPGDYFDVVPEDEMRALRAAGYFLDLWHWRANRSNPIGLSDDQMVAEARLSDSGRGMYATNWDGDAKQPRFMFNPTTAGRAALKWDDVVGGRIGLDSVYFIKDDEAVPFDPNASWQEGDTLPRRYLRASEGSRGDIKVLGKSRWENGFWEVTLQRQMDTGNPLDDKILVDKGVYQAAFAVHRNATGGRWHFVSLPYTVGLGRQADITAVRFEGETPNWQQPATEISLFYPGQVNWAMLNSRRHAGAEQVKAGVPVKYRHSEAQLAHYGVEVEFANEIRRQWLLTLFAGLLLIAGFGVAFNVALTRSKGV